MKCGFNKTGSDMDWPGPDFFFEIRRNSEEVRDRERELYFSPDVQGARELVRNREKFDIEQVQDKERRL